MRVRTHTNPFNFYTRLEKLDFASIFPNKSGELDLEIGFGRGSFLRQWAKLHPDRNIVGVEIRKNIVAELEVEVRTENLTNTHLILGNGEIVLEDCFDDKSITNIFLFHPDPWFKKSHHKRRVIRPQFLEAVCKKLKQNGKLYISTDVTPLWEAMEETLLTSGYFKKIEDSHFWQNIYTSNWHVLSEKQKRDFNFGTFSLI